MADNISKQKLRDKVQKEYQNTRSRHSKLKKIEKWTLNINRKYIYNMCIYIYLDVYYNVPKLYLCKVFNARMKSSTWTIIRVRELNMKLMSWIHIGWLGYKEQNRTFIKDKLVTPI